MKGMNDIQKVLKWCKLHDWGINASIGDSLKGECILLKGTTVDSDTPKDLRFFKFIDLCQWAGY